MMDVESWDPIPVVAAGTSTVVTVEQLARAIFDASHEHEAREISEQRGRGTSDHILDVMWETTKPAARAWAEQNARHLFRALTRSRNHPGGRTR